MTDRVEEIREQVEKAMPGPWFLETIGGNYAVRAKAADKQARDVAPPPVEPADAAFIAHAREDAPFLLSEIQRLRKVEEAARKVVREAENVESLARQLWQLADDYKKHTPGGGNVEFPSKTLGQLGKARASLSNALEQHVPEPVREEMER